MVVKTKDVTTNADADRSGTSNNNSKASDRKRSHSRDRDRRRSNSRDHVRDRDRQRDRDRDRHRDGDRDRYRRERDRDRDYRRRDRSPDRRDRNRDEGRDRRGAPSAEDRAAEAARREADDLTKDQRTMFVGQLTAKVDERMVETFFGQLGEVRSVTMVRDRGRHKGFAYVEMAELEAIPNCLLFHNAVPDFQKFPILVKASEAEKNYLYKKEVSRPGYQLPDNPSAPAPAPPSIQCQAPVVAAHVAANMSVGASQGALSYYGSNAPAPASEGKWELSEQGGSGGMHLNAQSRVALMHKLAGGSGVVVPPVPAPPSMPALPPAPSVGPVGVPSLGFVVENMFDLAHEQVAGGPEWQLDLQEDVVEECNRYSKEVGNAVHHVHVETVVPGGLVYVKFYSQQVANQAAAALHGRWFASRLIAVTFIPREQYDSKFSL